MHCVLLLFFRPSRALYLNTSDVYILSSMSSAKSIAYQNLNKVGRGVGMPMVGNYLPKHAPDLARSVADIRRWESSPPKPHCFRYTTTWETQPLSLTRILALPSLSPYLMWATHFQSIVKVLDLPRVLMAYSAQIPASSPWQPELVDGLFTSLDMCVYHPNLFL